MSKAPFSKRKYRRFSNACSEADLTRSAFQNYNSLRPKFPKRQRRYSVKPRKR